MKMQWKRIGDEMPPDDRKVLILFRTTSKYKILFCKQKDFDGRPDEYFWCTTNGVPTTAPCDEDLWFLFPLYSELREYK